MLVATTRTRAARRPGFSLAELLVAMVLLSIVGASVMSMLLKQQRFYNSTNDLMETRSQLRQATAILPTDLRAISSTGGDIKDLTASSIEFDATIGTGVVCEAGAVGGSGAGGGEQIVYLVPRTSSLGPITGWSSRPKSGDRAIIYDPVAGAFSTPRLLKSFGSDVYVQNAASGCVGSGFLPTAADLLADRHQLKIDVSATVPAATPAVAGSTIRILRRVKYNLFTSTDGLSYLGFSEDDGTGVLGTVQAVAGPFRAAAADTTSGFALAYFDTAGVALAPAIANAPQVARIDVVARALTKNRGSELAGMYHRSDGKYGDFAQFSVALRNRW